MTLGEITLSQQLTLLLDGSPLKGIQRWLWVLSTGGTLLDGFAIFVLGVAIPLMIAEFRFQSDVVGLIGASLVLGAVFGAGFGGLMADHLGRKPLMLADMIIIFGGAATSALAKGPAMLFIGQLLVGVGIGIDFPVSSSYVSEVLPKRSRARLMVATIACQALGMLLAAAITLVLLKTVDSMQNWRIFLASEGVIAFLFFLLRLSAPDSPNWLMSRVDSPRLRVRSSGSCLSNARQCCNSPAVLETRAWQARSRAQERQGFRFCSRAPTELERCLSQSRGS